VLLLKTPINNSIKSDADGTIIMSQSSKKTLDLKDTAYKINKH